MRFYTKPHRYYCGIDLHARRMYICVLDAEGQIRVPLVPRRDVGTPGPDPDCLPVFGPPAARG